uniref:Uncharacterized protein n=1 Tax=viral metagenome TaxID=1070528 RepID=A0A6H1ZFW0_9ZZZZ
MTKTIKIKEWEKEFNEKFACSCGDEDCDWLGNFYGSELKQFISTLLAQNYVKGYEDCLEEKYDKAKKHFEKKLARIHPAIIALICADIKTLNEQAISQVKKEEYERGFIDGGDASKTQESEIIICQLKEAEAKERKRQYELLMSCLPEDAENLSTLTDDQAKRLIDCFLKKSPWD